MNLHYRTLFFNVSGLIFLFPNHRHLSRIPGFYFTLLNLLYFGKTIFKFFQNVYIDFQWINQILPNHKCSISQENFAVPVNPSFSTIRSWFEHVRPTRGFDFSGSSIAISQRRTNHGYTRMMEHGNGRWSVAVAFCFWRGPIVVRAGTRSRIMSSNFDEEIIASVARAVSIRRTDLRRFFATELFVANIFADPMQSDARLFHLFFFCKM